MLSKSMTAVLAAVLLVGCATGATSDDQARWLQPSQAIQLAADAAPRGVSGVFSMQIHAVGFQDGVTYLNSETDYRDQRNLTIALSQAAARQVEARLGVPVEALEGKRIVVRGAARRVQINFTSDGLPTGKYYYQTHVRVTDAAQIQLQ